MKRSTSGEHTDVVERHGEAFVTEAATAGHHLVRRHNRCENLHHRLIRRQQDRHRAGEYPTAGVAEQLLGPHETIDADADRVEDHVGRHLVAECPRRLGRTGPVQRSEQQFIAVHGTVAVEDRLATHHDVESHHRPPVLGRKSNGCVQLRSRLSACDAAVLKLRYWDFG